MSPELAQRCPGGAGVNEKGCGPLHSGIACRDCDDSSAWDGTRCRSCEETPFRSFILNYWVLAMLLVMAIECLVLAMVYGFTVWSRGLLRGTAKRTAGYGGYVSEDHGECRVVGRNIYFLQLPLR